MLWQPPKMLMNQQCMQLLLQEPLSNYHNLNLMIVIKVASMVLVINQQPDTTPIRPQHLQF
uniref:Uncharacterized protein n=1 Tax=Rhizophora mucronata TaxID=61149 RepID=A0A2P2QW25_RHIMU